MHVHADVFQEVSTIYIYIVTPEYTYKSASAVTVLYFVCGVHARARAHLRSHTSHTAHNSHARQSLAIGLSYSSLSSRREQDDAANSVMPAAMEGDTGEPKVLESGYPLFPHQQRALDALPKQFVGRGIDKVEPTITPEELYEKYIKLAKPVVIKKGLLDNWGAWNTWKAGAIEKLHGDVVLQVARGPKPGISAEGEYKGSVGPDGTAAPEVDLADGVEETHENELQARWDRFMSSIAEREADGWTYDEEAQVLLSPDGGHKISIEPPPKPDPKPKPGARTTLGKPKAMSISKYIRTVVAPSSDAASGNATHPDLR